MTKSNIVKALDTSATPQTLLALLDRELSKANMRVKLKQKQIQELSETIQNIKDVYNVIKEICFMDKFVKDTINELTQSVEMIDERRNTQYAIWFKSKLLTEPVSQVDLTRHKKKLVEKSSAVLAGSRPDPTTDKIRLMAVAEEAAFELDLRVLVRELKELRQGAGAALGSAVCGKTREFSGNVEIYEKCEIDGRQLGYIFVIGPLELVEGLAGMVDVTENEIADNVDRWTSPCLREPLEIPVRVDQTDQPETDLRSTSVMVEFDFKSLLANERTFLSWANVATGVATAGAYLGNWMFLLTGLCFVWLALVLFILRRRCINQDKVGLVVRSPWFATLFASFVLAVVVLRITEL